MPLFPLLLALCTCTLLFFGLRAASILLLILAQRASHADDSVVPLRKRIGRAAGSASSAAAFPPTRPVRTLIVLGSGGHTAEMLAVLDAVPRAHFAPLLFVRAATDAASEARARRMETERGNEHQTRHQAIHRSREVGQSYLTSVLSTLRALAHSVHVVWDFQPEMVRNSGHTQTHSEGTTPKERS